VDLNLVLGKNFSWAGDSCNAVLQTRLCPIFSSVINKLTPNIFLPWENKHVITDSTICYSIAYSDW